jgi:hypothetical protein
MVLACTTVVLPRTRVFHTVKRDVDHRRKEGPYSIINPLAQPASFPSTDPPSGEVLSLSGRVNGKFVCPIILRLQHQVLGPLST